MLVATIPYTLYAVLSDRAGAERRTQEGFDAACSWIGCSRPTPGPILTRHPGEVFLQTGRHALSPTDGDNPAAISALIDQYGVAYLLTDGHRYANAPIDPLDRWIEAHPDRARRAWSEPGGVAVHEVVPVRVDGTGTDTPSEGPEPVTPLPIDGHPAFCHHAAVPDDLAWSRPWRPQGCSTDAYDGA